MVQLDLNLKIHMCAVLHALASLLEQQNAFYVFAGALESNDITGALGE